MFLLYICSVIPHKHSYVKTSPVITWPVELITYLYYWQNTLTTKDSFQYIWECIWLLIY